jgi:hypothetical protein
MKARYLIACITLFLASQTPREKSSTNEKQETKPSQQEYIQAALKENLQHGESCPVKCDTCQKALEETLEKIRDFDNVKKWATFDQPPSEAVEVAFRGLAFLSTGSTLVAGKYSSEINKALKLIQGNYSNGICTKSKDTLKKGSIWSMAISGIFLLELYARENSDSKTANAIKKGVDAIIAELEKHQADTGGWNHAGKDDKYGSYGPNVKQGFTFVSVWCLTFLVRAQKAGFKVPDSIISRCIGFMEKCTTKDGEVGYGMRNDEKNTIISEDTPQRSAGVLFTLRCMGRDREDKFYSHLKQFIQKKMTRNFHNHGADWRTAILFMSFACYTDGKDMWDQFNKEFRNIAPYYVKWHAKTTPTHLFSQPHLSLAASAIILQLPLDHLDFIKSAKK